MPSKTIQSPAPRGDINSSQGQEPHDRPKNDEGQESHDRPKNDPYYKSVEYHNASSELLESIEKQMHEKRQQMWCQAKQNMESWQGQPSITPATAMTHIQIPTPSSISRSQTPQAPTRSSRHQVPQHRALTRSKPPHPRALQPQLERTSRSDKSGSWRPRATRRKASTSPLRSSSSDSLQL